MSFGLEDQVRTNRIAPLNLGEITIRLLCLLLMIEAESLPVKKVLCVMMILYRPYLRLKKYIPFRLVRDVATTRPSDPTAETFALTTGWPFTALMILPDRAPFGFLTFDTSVVRLPRIACALSALAVCTP
jgi:hypothetical protein